MTVATASNGELENIRVIVYREGDVYVAQCIEHDIATQGPDIPAALARLDLTIDAECAISKEAGGQAFDNIPSAPNYFHTLWDKRSMTLTHVEVPVGHHYKMEVALAA